MGIEPSLLYPTSTSTSLVPTWTTRPRTTSPSSNSLVVPSVYQSSIRSSASAPSVREAPILVRGSSFAIPLVPPVNDFGASAGPRRPPRLRHISHRGRRPRRDGRRQASEARDGGHEGPTRRLVMSLAVDARRALKGQRRAERDHYLSRPRKAAALRPRRSTPLYVCRHHGRAGEDGQHRRPRLRLAQHALRTPRTFREHEQRPSVVQHP